MSSGFRLYPANAVRFQFRSRDYDILQEILAVQHAQGFSAIEVPLNYQQRKAGRSHARVFAFALQYLKTIRRLRRLKPQSAGQPVDEAAIR
jgi:hypothetical protein